MARYARELRCSRHRLLSICQRTLGQSLRVALEEHRMRRACALLTQDAAGIQQIALELGYPDPSYFSKAFRRVVGGDPDRLPERAAGTKGPRRHRKLPGPGPITPAPTPAGRTGTGVCPQNPGK